MGPPSSGGLLLLQMLGVLERLPESDVPPGAAQWRGAERLHRLAETMKRAFAMRALSRVCHPELTILAQQTSSSPLREMALIRLWVRQCSVTAVSV
jgi:gamma-glutamyltranspeptidase